MTKLEKVKKVILSLERCTCNVPDACQDCPYDVYPYPICNQKLDRDALELLKEQEPVKPKEVNMYPPGQYACGFCGHISVGSKDYHAKFCPECGRELKWE